MNLLYISCSASPQCSSTLRGYGHPLTTELPAAQNPDMSWSHLWPNYPRGPVLWGADRGSTWGQTPPQTGHHRRDTVCFLPLASRCPVSYFKAILIPLRQTDLKSRMMFQPPSVHAWEALIQAVAELNDARSFLHILITPWPLAYFGSFSLRRGFLPFLCS